MTITCFDRRLLAGGILILVFGAQTINAQQPITRRPSGGGEARVVEQQGRKAVQIITRGELQEVQLPARAHKVVDVAVSPGGERVVVIATPSVFAFDTRTRRWEDIDVRTASISPDGRYLAFEQFETLPTTIRGSVYIVEMDRFSKDANPDVVFPKAAGRATFRTQSDLTWLDDNLLVFLALDTTGGAVQVVGIDLAAGLKQLQVRQVSLNAADMVDPARYNSRDVVPGAVLYEPTITRLDGDGLNVRLKFPADPALKVRRVDVRLW